MINFGFLVRVKELEDIFFCLIRKVVLFRFITLWGRRLGGTELSDNTFRIQILERFGFQECCWASMPTPLSVYQIPYCHQQTLLFKSRVNPYISSLYTYSEFSNSSSFIYITHAIQDFNSDTLPCVALRSCIRCILI